MIKYALIDEIRKRNKISEYFISKGINDISRTSSRIKYKCPLHQEKKPSFMLYIDGEYENYFCWGCKQAGDIISIYSKLEGISYKETIRILGKEINITDEQELDLVIQKIKFDMENPISKKKAEQELEQLSLKFSILGYTVLEESKYDNDAFLFLEKVYRKIDDFIWKEDFTSLEEVYNMVLKEKLFNKKIKEFQDKIREREKEEISKRDINEQLGLNI